MRLAVTEDVPSVVGLLKSCVGALRTAGIDQWDEVYPTGETIQSDVACRSLYIAIDQAGSVAEVAVLNEVQDPEYSNPRALRLYEALGYRDAGPRRLRKGIFRGFEKRLTTNWRAPEHLGA